MSTLLPCGSEMSDVRGDDPYAPDEPMFSAGLLLGLAYSWSNVSKDQLVKAGVISGSVGGSDWKRFNDDPMMFIMKLPPEKLPALCRLLG